MSYWVYLEDRTKEPWCGYPEKCEAPCYPVVTVPVHEEGGTYVMGGTSDAEINITYNYGKQLYEAKKALGQLEENLKDWLNGRVAEATIPELAAVVGHLGTKRDEDDWASTPGNAGYAYHILLGWARLRPDAFWRVSCTTAESLWKEREVCRQLGC